MAVKTEGEKTAMLRRGMPGQPIRHGQSAKTMGGSIPTSRKDASMGKGKTKMKMQGGS